MDATTEGPLTAQQAASDLQTTQQIMEVRVRAESDELQILIYNGYFIMFGLGALLMLLYPFFPKRKRLTLRGFKDETALDAAEQTEARTKRPFGIEGVQLGLFGTMILMVLCAISHQTTVDRSRGFINEQNKRLEKQLREAMQKGPGARDELLREHYMYLPQEKSLRYLTLGNMGVAADFLWLTSLQYVSSPFRHGQKFDLLYHFYDNILESDPDWVECQVLAGRLLSALDPDRTQAERFYVRALTQNPNEWVIPYEAARHYVVPPSDVRRLQEFSRKASVFFEIALERKRLPQEARGEIMHLIGLLKSEAGQDEAGAKALFENANDPHSPPAIRGSSARQFLGPESRHRAKMVQDAVAEIKTKYGKYPPNLTALYAGKIPIDAYGLPLDYDPQKGTVSSRGLKLMNMIQYHSVLESMIGMYAGAQGRNPATLRELSQFIQRYYGNAANIPYSVKEAFGPLIDCETSPLGKPWEYDPVTGKVALPPEANAKVLQKNADAVAEGRQPPQFANPSFFAP